VRPLFERLEMMSLAKPDALAQLQLLFGGQAPPDAALAARVPEAKKGFELARQVPAEGAEVEAAAVELLGANFNAQSSSSAGTEAAEVAAAAATVESAAALQPEPVYVARGAAVSGAVSLLPESLQARLPATTVVNSQQQLQQLVAQLQQHQVRWLCPDALSSHSLAFTRLLSRYNAVASAAGLGGCTRRVNTPLQPCAAECQAVINTASGCWSPHA
jgi:HPt (histidine-containing phosphotransfer) domain-containing protein